MSSDETLSLARGIAADDPGTMRKLIAFGGEASNMMFDYADRLDNAINIATLGDVPDWLSTEIPVFRDRLCGDLRKSYENRD